jgi:protein gp37
MNSVSIALDKIKLDPQLQPRNELIADAIQQYAEDMRNGDLFPPITVVAMNGSYYLVSGWHRTLAAKRASLADIQAEIVQGNMADALWMASESNKEHDHSGSRRTNADKAKAVKMAIKAKVERNGSLVHGEYTEIANHVGVDRGTVKNHAIKLGYDIDTENMIDKKGISLFADPTPQRESNFIENIRQQREEAFWKEQEIEDIKEQIKTEKKATLNKTNDNIEWAAWSWNPVTGCLHDCPYCYARDIAERFYPEKFQPSFHPSRLDAPDNTNVPTEPRFPGDIGYKNIFTCSMADLFGKWVPVEWIDAVLQKAWDNPQWNFLFLSKFPIRMADFEFPPNSWIGTTVDRQYAVERAEKAFTKIRAGGYSGIAWLSCEPMLEDLTFSSLDMFDWVIMGGSSKSTQTPEFRPPFPWIVHLWEQAKTIDLPVYMKTNIGIEQRVREYPPQLGQ